MAPLATPRPVTTREKERGREEGNVQKWEMRGKDKLKKVERWEGKHRGGALLRVRSV